MPNGMIDQIGGWRSVGGVGASYGEGYVVEQIRVVMEIITIFYGVNQPNKILRIKPS